MEFHQLRYVSSVAETGSFSRAAERCQVAQPSLSQQVLKLEEELGAKLFDRLGRSVRLTEAGRAFLPHARAVLHQIDAARASVINRSADVRGSVAVGVIPTIAPYLMPRYTAAFAKSYPEAKLRILEETTPVLIENLRNLSIDLAILALQRAALRRAAPRPSPGPGKVAGPEGSARRAVRDAARRPLFSRSEPRGLQPCSRAAAHRL